MAAIIIEGRAAACPQSQEIPLFLCPVPAGSPFPTDHFTEGKMDLNQTLVPHPDATFFVRVSGDSMMNAGIYPGDLLIVDTAQAPRDGMIIIAALNGDLTVKRLATVGERILLYPENDLYQPIEVRDDMDFRIWGIVKHVIHSF